MHWWIYCIIKHHPHSCLGSSLGLTYVTKQAEKSLLAVHRVCWARLDRHRCCCQPRWNPTGAEQLSSKHRHCRSLACGQHTSFGVIARVHSTRSPLGPQASPSQSSTRVDSEPHVTARLRFSVCLKMLLLLWPPLVLAVALPRAMQLRLPPVAEQTVAGRSEAIAPRMSPQLPKFCLFHAA
jgi:hypothetical protein